MDRSEAPTGPPESGRTAYDDETLASSGERAVFAWLEAGEEEPPPSCDGVTVRFDASGRYVGASVDRPATRVRRLHRLAKQWAATEYAAALATAERMLDDDPADREALRYAANCRAELEEMHVAALGGRLTVYRLQTGGRISRALEMDDRTRLLVALVRRGASLGEILDAHGPTKLAVLLLIAQLVKVRLLERS